MGLLSDILRDFKSFTEKELINAIIENSVENRKEWIIQQFKWYGKHSPQRQFHQVWKHSNHTFWLESTKMINQIRD